MPAPIPGICRHCGCTEANACLLHDGDACCWIDASRTVCNRPGCINAEAARVAQEKAAAKTLKPRSEFAGWGYGAIVKELDRRRRQKRRGKRKAA